MVVDDGLLGSNENVVPIFVMVSGRSARTEIFTICNNVLKGPRTTMSMELSPCEGGFFWAFTRKHLARQVLASLTPKGQAVLLDLHSWSCARQRKTRTALGNFPALYQTR